MEFGRLGCAHARHGSKRGASFAPCCGESGPARTLHRLLTSVPLAVVSGRDAKGYWCSGCGRVGTSTFLGAPELSPGTAAVALEKSGAGSADTQTLWWTTWRALGWLGSQPPFQRLAPARHAAAVVDAVACPREGHRHREDRISRCECLRKPEARQQIGCVHKPTKPSDPIYTSLVPRYVCCVGLVVRGRTGGIGGGGGAVPTVRVLPPLAERLWAGGGSRLPKRVCLLLGGGKPGSTVILGGGLHRTYSYVTVVRIYLVPCTVPHVIR